MQEVVCAKTAIERKKERKKDGSEAYIPSDCKESRERWKRSVHPE